MFSFLSNTIINKTMNYDKILFNENLTDFPVREGTHLKPQYLTGREARGSEV